MVIHRQYVLNACLSLRTLLLKGEPKLWVIGSPQPVFLEHPNIHILVILFILISGETSSGI